MPSYVCLHTCLDSQLFSDSCTHAVFYPPLNPREPASCYDQLLSRLRQRCGFRLPVSEDDWMLLPRTRLLIRRELVLKDALRQARRDRFDPAKLLSVCVDKQALSTGLDMCLGRGSRLWLCLCGVGGMCLSCVSGVLMTSNPVLAYPHIQNPCLHVFTTDLVLVVSLG